MWESLFSQQWVKPCYIWNSAMITCVIKRFLCLQRSENVKYLSYRFLSFPFTKAVLKQRIFCSGATGPVCQKWGQCPEKMEPLLCKAWFCTRTCIGIISSPIESDYFYLIRLWGYCLAVWLISLTGLRNSWVLLFAVMEIGGTTVFAELLV